MSDLVGTDHEQIMRRAAEAAAEALKPSIKLCRDTDRAARAWADARPIPHPNNQPMFHVAAQNAANSVADAMRVFQWIAAGCPPPGEK